MVVQRGALYTFRTKHDHFKIGDRLDLGTALAWHFGQDHHAFPQWSVFGELNAVIGFKDRESGAENPNTGGTTLYLTPGVRVRFTENIALTVAPSFPVYQDLNGDQDETRFKVAAAVSISF